MSITPEQIRQSYLAARRAYNGELSPAEAVQHLSSRHGLNRSTANTFVRVLPKMLTGQLYTRGLSVAATRHYLESIRVDNTTELSNALTALMLHIPYYEDSHNANMHSLRALHKEFFNHR
ncbi:hypothetical protein [Hymenobacter sp. BRD67]|uniref:hypothetical protein n=1 Tax=Hymenobacter sp. BRD67 TaxID=2675877 RepID=UPI001563BA69|nr:hypothetical protein [Hymenobacter sp. BRD67]QKG52881.1 hypothetical protein GKZ67_10040 [Hymenobacter sp. BRD67]